MFEKSEKFLIKHAEKIESDTFPPPRFGQTVNLISKTSVLIFAGAISTPPSSFTMTSDLFIYNIQTNKWAKVEIPKDSPSPPERAAHASATVRDNQVLFYGGSIGSGQYAPDDLWFLDIKDPSDAQWMKVPVEGPTPGQRYGHSMVYITPNLILFGGSTVGSTSQKNQIVNDVWIFGTEEIPFKWMKVQIKNNIPMHRLYHSACILDKSNGKGDMMILFGGRNAKNESLNDLYLLKRDKSVFEWYNANINKNEYLPAERHQQSATSIGPFLIVVGGRTGGNKRQTFDVFSFISQKWYRFGSIGLFRHSVWIYFNHRSSIESVELYLYVYGGFDSDNFSEINPNFYRVNLITLFNKYDVLKKELSDYIQSVIKKSIKNVSQPKKVTTPNNPVVLKEENKGYFELNSRVVVYSIPEENNFGSLIKEISYSKLTEVDRKISEAPSENKVAKKKSDYDEENIQLFLQLLPNPDDEFIPLSLNNSAINQRKESILKLILDCKTLLSKTQTVITLRSPVKIYGNINGQYNDLMRYFSLFGRPSEFKGDIECMDYLFLGNIINRGAFSLEVFCLLISLKLKYPKNFHILRGSHEDIDISKQYGLAEECKNKLGENINEQNSVFQKICQLFEYFPLAAVINSQILCVHSGIGKNTPTITSINIPKPYSVADSPVAQDILWSRPQVKNEGDMKHKIGTANNGYRQRFFDEGMVKEFLGKNKMKMIIRSHDVCESGIEKIYNDRVISIFSAINYCGVYRNSGGILLIKKSYEIQPKILTSEENYSVWIKDWGNSDCPPSPKLGYNKEKERYID